MQPPVHKQILFSDRQNRAIFHAPGPMNYFFALNFALLLGSMFIMRTLVIHCSGDRLILAPVLSIGGYKKSEFRFFPDLFYTMGIIYSFLCGLLFLSNCIEIWHIWGLFTIPDGTMIGNFLLDRQIFFHFLCVIGLAIAFFILPDRTMKLRDAQPVFISFSLAWLSTPLLGILLCQ